MPAAPVGVSKKQEHIPTIAVWILQRWNWPGLILRFSNTGAAGNLCKVSLKVRFSRNCIAPIGLLAAQTMDRQRPWLIGKEQWMKTRTKAKKKCRAGNILANGAVPLYR
jgi:hypothetical protein